MPADSTQPSPPSPASSDMSTRPVLLVTGGSRGIGRAICLEFGRAGWRVGIHYRERHEEAEETAAAVAAHGGEGACLAADIRDPHQVDTMVQDLIARWGRLDVMVCNAGIASSRLLLRLNFEEWTSVLATNLTGVFLCLRAAGRHMLARQSGSIVIIGSFAGLQGFPGQSAYAASKAGLVGLMKTAAREWGTHNVRVNLVLPGWHRTALADGAMPGSTHLERHALGRTPDLGEVARTIYHVALLNDASGQVWNLDSRIL